MLYPQVNPWRQYIDLSGFWDFRFADEGGSATGSWSNGFEGRPIAVPASWNDQFADHREYLGEAWYQTRFERPWGWEDRRVLLRFGSVNYIAEVWLNGARLGQHEGGHLPFEFEVTDLLRATGNLLVVRVDGALAPDRVPPGNIPSNPLDTFVTSNYPDTSFDFFPFCGIHRPVLLYATPHQAISDITVVTEITGSSGRVTVQLERTGLEPASAQLSLRGHGADVVAELEFAGAATTAMLTVPDAALWAPGSPNLYDLTVELHSGGATIDRYTLAIGIRTIAVDGHQLLLNGEPIRLTGFGRHEDFPITGRGLLPAVIVKDYALLEWIGANSFRTSHYPYSEQMMDLADRLGFLVIDETPAVGLFFGEEGLDRRLALCKQYIESLVARDKNHPSVIMWSVANEPHSKRPPAVPFFRELYDLTKSLDATRPVTLVNLQGVHDASFAFYDVVCLNRYNGWYANSGRLEEGFAALSAELDALYALYPKPFILAEFGADTLPGWHAQPSEMFSEEYQAEMLAGYLRVFESKPFVIGEHIWNMCDFKTGQGVHRTGSMNFKGVFTRDRRPKLAAHRLREIWRGRQDH